MGGNSSKQTIETTLQTDVLNKNIQNFITTNSQEVSATATNIQKMDIVLGNVTGCDLVTKQKIDSSVITTGELSSTDLSQLKTTADTHLDNNVDALMEKMSGFASIQFDNDTEQDVKQTITNKLRNITEKTFDTSNYNKLISSVVNLQDKKLIIGDYDCTNGGKIDLEQDIASEVIATAITEQLVDRFIEDEQVAEVINKIETEQSNRDEGVGEAVGVAAEGVGEGVGNAFRGIGEGIGNIFGGGSAGSIIALIVVILMLLGLGYYFTKKKGGRSSPPPYNQSLNTTPA